MNIFIRSSCCPQKKANNHQCENHFPKPKLFEKVDKNNSHQMCNLTSYVKEMV